MGTFTLAHLTDVHLGPIAGFSPRYWNLKRALGYVNWVRNRRDAYRREVLDRLVADMLAQAPDHIAVTGDLANIGLPAEHAGALGWLEALGPPERVSVVPGNHDIYSSIGRDPGTRRWAAYMASDAAGAPFAVEGEAFPFVRVIGDVALVGVNSAVPTPPLAAWGRIGAAQIARLRDTLGRLGDAGLFRLVLVHHPPLPGQAGTLRGLRDARMLEVTLQRPGAELVVHGHNHLNDFATRPSYRGDGVGRVSIVGAPSASLGRPYKGEPLARYNLYRIAGSAPPWTIELIGRGLAEPGGPMVELERRKLAAS